MQLEDPTEMGTRPERRKALRTALMVAVLFMCALITQELLNPSNPRAPLIPRTDGADSLATRPQPDSVVLEPRRRPQPILLEP
jgi:hypothetical protein